MININDFKEFVFFVMNKEGKGSVSPSEFNIATNSALRTWTMRKYGNDVDVPFNANVPKKGWQINHKATDDLRHLQEFRLLSVVDGKMKIPNGEFFDLDGEIAPKYLHFSSFNYDFYKKDGSLIKVPIQILRDSEFSLIESSEINIPTKRFPKARVLDDVIEVVPNSILSVYLGYLRQPKEASWGYVLENERPVYDESISKDIDAPVEAFNDVALLTLNLMGINLRDGELSQYSQAKTQEGL